MQGIICFVCHLLLPGVCNNNNNSEFEEGIGGYARTLIWGLHNNNNNWELEQEIGVYAGTLIWDLCLPTCISN